MNKLTFLLSGVLILGLCVTASADTLDLFPPPPSFVAFQGQDIGNYGIGVVFDAVTSFSINDAAIKFDPLNGQPTTILNIQSVIYSVTKNGNNNGIGDLNFTPVGCNPNNPNAIPGNCTAIPGTDAQIGLANSANTPVVDSGLQLYDTLINFSFIAGNRYAIEFFANDNQAGTLAGWGTGANNTDRASMTFWEYDPVKPGYAPFDVGPSGTLGKVTVLDGAYVGDGYVRNSNFPAIQLSGIPEPGTVLLLGSATLLLFVRARRRTR